MSYSGMRVDVTKLLCSSNRFIVADNCCGIRKFDGNRVSSRGGVLGNKAIYVWRGLQRGGFSVRRHFGASRTGFASTGKVRRFRNDTRWALVQTQSAGFAITRGGHWYRYRAPVSQRQAWAAGRSELNDQEYSKAIPGILPRPTSPTPPCRDLVCWPLFSPLKPGAALH
jgi:hypothetical protein